MTISIVTATLADLADVARLFRGYLDFYDAPGDRGDAESFIRHRMERSESTILLARERGAAVGFAQVYPTFSSVRRASVWILNDLFVHPDHRRSGAGRALLRAVADQAAAEGVVRVELSTDETNHEAQALYEAEGYVTGLPVRYYVKRIA